MTDLSFFTTIRSKHYAISVLGRLSPRQGFTFVGSQAMYRQIREQIDEIVTQAQQPEAEDDIIKRLKQYGEKYQENLQQIKLHQHKCRELLKESKSYVKQTKLELAKLTELKKNIAKARFCLAETCL